MTTLAKREPIAWERFLPATLFLAGSTGLATLWVAALVRVRDVEGFLTSNQASFGARLELVIYMLAAGALAAGIALIAAWRGRGTAARGVERVARLIAPLALLWAVQALAVYKIWYSRPLEFLILLTFAVLAFEQTLRASLSALPAYPLQRAGELQERIPVLLRRALPWLVVIAGASGYAIFTGYWSIIQHQRLATASYDLGIYDNLMYNAYAGHPFRSPVLYGGPGGNYIASHAEWAMVLLVPLYALFPRAETLLGFQAVMFGFAAVPLYAFAKTQIPRWSAVLVALAYLLYAPLHGPNFYDFHWLPISIFVLFCLFWALAAHRNVAVWCFFFLAISIREDIPVGLSLLGIFMLVAAKRVALGISMTVLAVISFVLIKFVAMPAAGGWWFENIYKDLIPPGQHGYESIVQTILINPAYFLTTLLQKEKLIYALHLFAPLAFLPARRLVLLLGAGGGFFFTLMTTGYPWTLSIAFQYSSHWIPYLFGAAVLALRWMGQDPMNGVIKRRAATGALCLGVTLHSLVFGCLLQQSHFVGGFQQIPFKITDEERARYAELRKVIALIPEEASVAATDSESPHITNRVSAYSLNLDIGEPEYILIRRGSVGGGDPRNNLDKAFSRNQYALVFETKDYVLIRRGYTTVDTKRVLAELGVSVNW
ncbi:MAG TPA: DUF2079 domain-containing protein [Polyangiaceae bacterium]|nr:DUF2079 domain-containing protein [Polyangiaceae bacterium]